MELRPELRPPVVGPQRIAEFRAAIEAIEGLLDGGESADAAIDAFNAETGHGYDADYFRCYSESRSIEALALEAARPARPRVANVTRDELVEIVRRIQAAGDDLDYYVRLLQANVVHPGITDLILWPPLEMIDASPEPIVDTALSYQPIAL